MQGKKITYFIFIALFSVTSLNAFCQQAINISSHSATINGLKFDYSIGEMTLVTTEKNANLIVTQGFLQPVNQSKATNSNPANTGISSSNYIKVYPNPTENILFVESIESADIVFSYQLFDATGKVIINKKITQKAGPGKFSIDLSNFAAGSYYLIIRKPNALGIQENFSYKIQKTN